MNYTRVHVLYEKEKKFISIMKFVNAEKHESRIGNRLSQDVSRDAEV